MIHCLNNTRRAGRWAAALLLLSFFVARPAGAVVLVVGDVAPVDDVINTPFDVEGIVDYQFDPFDPDQLDFANPENIIVGNTGFGALLINGGSTLRYEHLIIGGDEADADGDTDDNLTGSTFGVGVVRIEGFGTLYNNDPDILPGELSQSGIDEGAFDSTPRTGTNLDVYVGLTGSGTLQVVDGARMEIQDGLIIGLGESAYGEMLVDGFATHIDQRGGGGDSGASLMLIGPVGVGVLTIQNGAQVDARNGAALGALSEDGGVGVIGGGSGGIPGSIGFRRGGRGVATVDGLGSTWRITNGLSVGEYQEDAEDYESIAGEGELTVSNRGLVNLLRDVDDTTDPADLLIGRFGRVNLENGRIALPDDLTSDGLLRGSGRVDTSHFSNRVLGEVRVGLDEHLIISSDAEVAVTDDSGPFFLANDGLVEVIGGQIEFQRLRQTPADAFQNREVITATGMERGTILGQNAVLRFHSGLSNEGVVALTQGTNVVVGDVVNELDGDIIISGFSNVTFVDDFINNGNLELAPDGSVVSVTYLGEFISTAAASLNLNLGGGPTGAELSHIAVAGDIGLGGELLVALSTTGSNPIDPMPGDRFELISGAGALTGAFNVLTLPTLPTGLSWLIDTTNSDFALVVSGIMATGADFNGDMIVDAADVAIWEMNFGITMGATGVLGDADGDGDVDGVDYFYILQQLGGPGMVIPPGALTTGGIAGGPQAVPEPSSVALALLGLAAVGWTRRRASPRLVSSTVE